MKEAKSHESPCAGAHHHLEHISRVDRILLRDVHTLQLLMHSSSGFLCGEVYHVRLQLASLHKGKAGHQVFEDDGLHHPPGPPAVQGQDVVGLGQVRISWVVCLKTIGRTFNVIPVAMVRTMHKTKQSANRLFVSAV